MVSIVYGKLLLTKFYVDFDKNPEIFNKTAVPNQPFVFSRKAFITLSGVNGSSVSLIPTAS
jgi:hypothetical protein